jgi:hypothetical protein
MGRNCIRIERLWSDVHCIELKVSAYGLDTYSSISFYVDENGIKDIAKKLCSFPSRDDVIIWSIGSESNDSYAKFMFRIYLYDKHGHVAIEVKMNNNSEAPYTADSRFFIRTEVGSINEFGRKMSELLGEDGTIIEGIIHI